jgi:uncharacterized membrane protein
MNTAPPSNPASTTAKNIESILRLEKEDDGRLPSIDRVSHAVGWFAGTIYFVILQCVIVGLWVGWNSQVAGNGTPFDPYPFPLLSTLMSLEAVLLTSFVLIRQNAMDRRSERRNHLDLQINLLAEKEATSILKALSEISEHLNVVGGDDTEREELAKDTPVETIARELRSREAKN